MKTKRFFLCLMAFVALTGEISAQKLTLSKQLKSNWSDMVTMRNKPNYVMELKYDDTVDAALDQIDRKGYADKYALDGRPVTKVGISFSSKERNITDWKAVTQG